MKRFRVLAALLMAAAAIGGSKVDAQAAPYYYQEEIDETSLATQRWARSAIHWAYADGLTVGGGTEAFSSFMPDNTITRAEAVTMMTKLKEIEIDDYRKDSAVFTDVNGAWYTPYVNAAYENGIVAGKGEGIFDPMGTLTRAEAITMIVKALDYKPNSESNVPFEDIDGAWYTDYIKTAYDNGIVVGKTPTIFDPNGKVTRAEFCMMLYKTTMAVNEKGIYSAVMIPDDAKGFQLVKDGEIKLSYDSKTKTVTGATKVKQCKDASTRSDNDPWQMVYFEPMDSFELIPTEDGEVTLMRFFANGHEVDLDGSHISKAVFTNDKKVYCYRDEIGKMYPQVSFSMNPFCRAETDDGMNNFVVLTDTGTLVGGDTEGFRLTDVQFPMGERIVEHDTSSYVLHASLSNVCLKAGADFGSGALMLYSDPKEDTYFMSMDKPTGSGTCKLWIDGEDYDVQIADDNLRCKDVSLYKGDYDQDGEMEYLLTADNREATGERDWYLIEVNGDRSTYVTKVDQNDRLVFGEGEPYIIAEQDKLIFSDGDKVYPLIAKNGLFQSGEGWSAPFRGATAELQHKDFDGDGELEYAVAYVCSMKEPDPSAKKEILMMIEIRDDKAELFECSEDDDEEIEKLRHRLNEDGYVLSVPGSLQFELTEDAILFYVDAIDSLVPERNKLFIGEVTYHEDGTFGLDEEEKGAYQDYPEEMIVASDSIE